MKLNIVFSTPDPATEDVVNIVLRSIDNLIYPKQVDIKQRCQWCKQDKFYLVDALDLIGDHDFTNLIHGSDGEKHVKIYYTRKNCKVIMNQIWDKKYSDTFYLDIDKNYFSCYTWFEELYNEPELSEHQKILDEIIIIS
jgi:hypothetical protein